MRRIKQLIMAYLTQKAMRMIIRKMSKQGAATATKTNRRR